MNIGHIVNLNAVSVKALNISSRLKLAKSLNPEQNLLSSEGYARDYRGLAEQMNFNYDDIKNFQRNENPTMKILEAWDFQQNATIGKLIEFLERMGRHDVIQENEEHFENDAKMYQLKHSQDIPVQVPEVTSCPTTSSGLNDQSILTREDANTGECTYYDAYISYADEDIEFVYYCAKYLEDSGFKLFIRSRDLLAGHSEYDINMQLIKERCKRVILVMTPDFINCPACKVQVSFAAGLGYEERCRKIVPILLKPCTIPMNLKYVSRIDFTKPDVQDWIWDKLKSSLRDVTSSVFVSSERRPVQGSGMLPQLESSASPDSENPCITFPPSTAYPLSLSASTSACISAVETVQHETINDGTATAVKTLPIKQKNKLRNLKFWQAKNAKKDGYLSSNSISLSNATSGFHSQSGNVLESLDS